MLEEQVLNPALHDRAGFQSGDTALDDYLQRHAAQQSAKGIATVFVLVDDKAPATILGFYTLSAAQLEVEELGPAERKKLPRCPVPCFRMGRLATHLTSRKMGMGKLLMGLAVDRCLKAKDQVGADALLVDAKHETARSFYRHYGFTACIHAPMTLYLPLGL